MVPQGNIIDMKIVKNKSICLMTISHPKYGVGGAEIQTYTYAEEYARQGWKVYFISEELELKKSGFENKNITLITYRRSNMLVNIINIMYCLFKVNADVYYYRHYRYILGLISFITKYGKKVSIWSTTSDPLCDHLAATKHARDKRSVNERNIFSEFKYSLQDYIFRYGVINCNYIFVQNSTQQQIVKKSFGRDSIIFYSNTTISEYRVARKNTILFIATMKDMKKPEIFCTIANKMTDDHEYIMIGLNYADMEKAENLNSILERSKVKYIGEQPVARVKQLLNDSLLLINTSDYEGFPNTFVQAWAAGVPVISLNVDPDGLIKRHGLGYIGNGDLKLMINDMTKIMNNDDLWKSISNKCYEYASNNLNTNRTVLDMSKLMYPEMCE
jgi:glycosyltransferase involved in cell wall biosynthesis